jgi:hypothetical protein
MTRIFSTVAGALVLAGMLAAACSSSARPFESPTIITNATVGERATYVPFVAPAVSPTPQVADATVRPCLASDLGVNSIGTNAYTGGMLLEWVGIVNLSSTACALALPRVQLISDTGKIIDAVPEGRPCASVPLGRSAPCIFEQPLLLAPMAATGPRIPTGWRDHPDRLGYARWRRILHADTGAGHFDTPNAGKRGGIRRRGGRAPDQGVPRQR